LDDVDNAQLARLSIDDAKHDHAKVNLHLRVLVQIIQNDLSLLAALQFDNDAHAIAIALVANIGNAFELLIGDQRRNLLNQPCLVDLEWDLGNDDRLAILAALFGRGAGPEFHAAPASRVVVEDARAP